MRVVRREATAGPFPPPQALSQHDSTATRTSSALENQIPSCILLRQCDSLPMPIISAHPNQVSELSDRVGLAAMSVALKVRGRMGVLVACVSEEID